MEHQSHLGLPSLRSILPLSLLALTSIVVLALYDLALPGRYLFDDAFSLRSLANVKDWPSALAYVTSAPVGALGRPVALASFALQADAWPDAPAAFLRVNFFIHMLGLWACFLLAFGLARLRPLVRGHVTLSIAPVWIGVAVAVLWGLSPFLATTHLVVIQRMTSLSGLLVLAGLAAFVWAHLFGPTAPRLARTLLVLGLGVGTALAALSKENGALLPLLALCILWLWIPAERRLTGTVDRLLIGLLGVLPSLLLLAYLAHNAFAIAEHGYRAIRYFTPAQRLLSQPIILLDYLQNLLLPGAVQASPYMDWLPAPTGWLAPPMTSIAAAIWALFLGLGIGLRRHAPWLLFGLCFFLVGHLIESSFLDLELYFAHRNYVPAFGIYFALVFAIASVPATYQKLAVTGLSAYALLCTFVLFQVTSSWGQLQYIGEAWMTHNPYSERGAQFLSGYHIDSGDLPAARRVLDAVAERNPRIPLIQIERTMICMGQEEQFPQLLEEVLRQLPTAYYEPIAAVELAHVAQHNPSAGCAKRDHATLGLMADALLANPLYRNDPTAKPYLLLTKAFASLKANRQEEARAYATQALQINQDPRIANLVNLVMMQSGQGGDVDQLMEELRRIAPVGPQEPSDG